MKVPYLRNLVQGAKSGSEPSDEAAQESAAREVVSRVRPDEMLILGPGTTTRTAAKIMGLEKTLLGVDAYLDRQIAARDASEKELLELLKDRTAKIVVTPIGGQGHIFGRGNQQISAEIIRQVGKENILVISTREKIHSLRGRPLFTDTGDRELDEKLSGYIRVITGNREEIVYPLTC
jgi:predicted polyphosphate/ATP-dependent NAD kinase